MKITKDELNSIIEFIDGSRDAFYGGKKTLKQIAKEYADGDGTTVEELYGDDAEVQHLLERFGDWKVWTSDDGSCPDHDGQMYDNWLHLQSPGGKENQIYDRHCLMNGFHFWEDVKLKE